MTAALTSKQLLDVLCNLEERSKTEVKGLPSHKDSALYWEGFVFQAARQLFMASMEEVVEILNQAPPITRVPGAKSWVRGVANLRGTLLPVMDLQQLLGGRPLVLGRRSRILVIDQDGVSTGLLVASVAGRKRFLKSDFTRLQALVPAVRPFVSGGFVVDDTEWPVFNISKLMQFPDYQSAAR
jgi:twitching motility protein PilI